MDKATALAERLFYPVFVYGRGILIFWLGIAISAENPELLPPVVLAFLVASLAILAVAERLLPYRTEWLESGDPQIWNDVGHSFAYIVLGSRLGQILVLSIIIALVGSAEARLWTGIWPDAWPLGARIALVIVLGDLLEYWYHRLSHTVSWMWPIHVLHHTPDRIHAFKTYRHHWLYAVGRSLFVSLPLVLAGAPVGILFWPVVAISVVGSISHANVRLRMSPFWYRVLNTPELHRIHHSVDPAHHNANYCFVLPIWDVLFGSFVAPERTTVRATGLTDDPVPDGFLRQLALPLTLRR